MISLFYFFYVEIVTSWDIEISVKIAYLNRYRHLVALVLYS